MLLPPDNSFSAKTRRFLPQETPRFRFRIGLGSVMICVGCIVSDRKRLRKLPGGIFLRCFFLEFLSPHGVSDAEMSHFPRFKTSPRGSVPLHFQAKQPKNTHQICMYSHFLPQEPPRELFLPPIHRAILIVSKNGVKSQKRGGKTTKWALFLDFRHFYAMFSGHSGRYCRFPSTNCVRFPERRRALLPLRGSISDFSPFAQKAAPIFI